MTTLDTTHKTTYIGEPTETVTMTDSVGWLPIININDHSESGYEPEEPEQIKVTRGGDEGYLCIGCGDFFPQADLNWPEQEKKHYQFKCYCCRKGLVYRF